MELIDIVDKNGIPTGEVMDKDDVHNKNFLHNEIGVFIINNSGEILLEKRSPNKRYSPNKWGLCAGHVDTGETLIEAAIREIHEEIGIDVLESDLTPFGNFETFIDDTNSHLTHFYYLKCNKKAYEFIIQKEELTEVKWFKIDDIINMINNNDTSTVFTSSRLNLFEELKNITLK